jgi:hypothetical protein
MTGGIGGVLGEGEREPRAGKSDEEFTKLIFGGVSWGKGLQWT